MDTSQITNLKGYQKLNFSLKRRTSVAIIRKIYSINNDIKLRITPSFYGRQVNLKNDVNINNCSAKILYIDRLKYIYFVVQKYFHYTNRLEIFNLFGIHWLHATVNFLIIVRREY